MNQTTRTKIAIPRLLLLLALVLAPLSVVQADIIRLKDGRELEGEIVGKTATTLRVKVNEFAVVEVKATQVKSIESKPTPWQLFADKLAALDKADVEGRFKLAMWAKEHNLNKRYRELLKAVITLNPDHAKARLELGYVNDNGKWLTEAQYYKKKGFEKYRGRWLPKDEVKLARARDGMKKDIKKYLIDFRRGRQKAIAAESAILNLKPAEIAGPLLIKHLEDRKTSIRILIARALGTMKYRPAHDELLKLAQTDDEYDVAYAAAMAMWSLEPDEITNKTRVKFVQGLFDHSKRLRTRTAQLLGEIRDSSTIPYLIEGLFLTKTKIVTKVREISGVSRGGVRRRGIFGEYNLPSTGRAVVGQTERVRETVYEFNDAARETLKAMTGVDYDFDKQAWFKWWKEDMEKRKAAEKKKKP